MQLHGRMDREPPQHALLETILVRWFNTEGRKLASHDAARHALLKWSNHFPGALVSEVAERLDSFVEAMAAAGLSDGYVRRTLAIGKRALNWAHEKNLLDRAPFVKLPAESEPRARALTKEEAVWFLRATAADLPHVQLYVALAFGTAARPAAILELSTWQQIDIEARVIHLNPPGRKQNKKRRPSIPMAEFLVPLLSDLPSGRVIQFNGKPLKSIRMAIERVRERARAMMRDDAAARVLAAWRAGDRRGAVKLLEDLKAAADAMLDMSAYTIRHTVATELRGRGVQPWELAGFLGHSTGYRTTEGYAKNRPTHLHGVCRAVEAYYADLGVMLGGVHRGPFVKPEQRSNCVLPGQGTGGDKPPVFLVEPRGIEPLTSTMPL